MIQKIQTGHPYVCRFDNVFSKDECLFIKRFVLNKFPIYDKINQEKPPFHENQNLSYNNVKEISVKKFLNCYRIITTQFIMDFYKQNSYPTFTDLVLWQTNRSMGYHVDNGYGLEKFDYLFTRSFSSVLYINDDYKGGETVIKGYNGSSDYISKPKTGSIIIFKSDHKCEHKVNKILTGNRITAACWFTLQKQDIEI